MVLLEVERANVVAAACVVRKYLVAQVFRKTALLHVREDLVVRRHLVHIEVVEEPIFVVKPASALLGVFAVEDRYGPARRLKQSWQFLEVLRPIAVVCERVRLGAHRDASARVQVVK